MTNWLIAFLFFLPAGAANMAPVLANKIPLLNRWNTPLDFGRHYHGERILGDNKRWRGLVFGCILAAAVALLEGYLLFREYSFVSLILAVLTGALMGFGALMGDAVESFIKRQRGIKPGQTWFPFDQIDYIVGGLLVVTPLFWPLLESSYIRSLYWHTFVLYFGLHLLVSYIGFLLGLKDRPI